MKSVYFVFSCVLTLISLSLFSNETALSKENLAEELKAIGYNVLQVSNGGDNALHLAVKKQNLDAISLLLDYGFHPSRANKGGNTPLHLAAAKGNLPICISLLKRGADLNSENELGQTPYHKAMVNPYPNLISLFESYGYRPTDPFKDYLIASGLQPDKIDNAGNHLLHRLAKTKNVELMRATLERGYSPEVWNNKGESPLSFAIKNKDLQMLQLIDESYHLLTLESHPFPGEWTLITENDFKTAIQALWKEGLAFIFETNPKVIEPLINEHNEKGINAFHYACAKGDLEIIKMFIDNGANLNLLTLSEYHYGPNDPIHWTRDDWDAFSEFSMNGDLAAYSAESGHVHPVASPLAIVSLLHPEQEDLISFLTDLGARYDYKASIDNQELQDYLK